MKRNVVGVRFKKNSKVYYFDPKSKSYKKDDKVIVTTQQGTVMGEVVFCSQITDKDENLSKLKPIDRLVTKADMRKQKENERLEKKAFSVCEKCIEKLNLVMKLVDVECLFDRTKLLFYFTANGRIDFRELVKQLAGVFRTRIEMRQIGVRDEAKLIGGFGICGRTFCCTMLFPGFQPVSIKMAKEQGLSLNPSKISGMCGRLMCCLKYEQEAYDELLETTPLSGSIVETPDGEGVVTESNAITGMLHVKLNNSERERAQSYSSKDIKIIKDARNDDDKGEFERLKHLER